MQELIEKYVPLESSPVSNWARVFCEVCGDGTHSKGKRGGWKFDGECVYYKCFNCGHTGSYDPEREKPVNHGMWEVLLAFGIPKREIIPYAYPIEKRLVGRSKESKPKLVPKAISSNGLPPFMAFLRDFPESDPLRIRAIKFLQSRGIEPDSYRFCLPVPLPREHEHFINYKTLENRLLIPSFMGNKLVFVEGRDLREESEIPEGEEYKKYKSLGEKSKAIIGYENLYSHINRPLFVAEGFFDIQPIGGVAVLENSLTLEKVEILNKTPREKVVVYDRGGDSKKLALDAIRNGWGVSFINCHNVKDINDAIIKYGKLFVVASLMKNIHYGNAALSVLKMFK